MSVSILPSFSYALKEYAAQGRTALILPETENRCEQHISYAMLVERIRSYACGCAALLPMEDDVFIGGTALHLAGILAERNVETIAAFFGLIDAGFCPAFMEPRISLSVLAERMDSVAMRILLTDKPLTDTTPFSENVRTVPLEVCRAKTNTAKQLPERQKSAPAMMLFTSGSTGASKGVVLSHGNLDCNARGVIAMTGLTREDRLLHIMPIYHANGINNQLIAPLLVGATVILADRFRPEHLCALLERYSVTYMTGTPTHYSRALPFLQKPVRAAALSSLRFLRCGSAPITPELHRAVEDAFGVELLVSYGLSEATCTSAMNPPGKRRIGSIGRALEGQQVALFKPDSPEAVKEGEEGEICISGGSLMLGYAGKEQKQPIMNGWLRTGDLGRCDSDGFVTITGRLKDIIVRGGENISPGLIENIIRSHEAVSACCVVGAASADLGEVPVAFVVPHDGRPVTEEDLRRTVATALKPAYVPERWYFLTALPENALGKVDRKALRALT